MYGVVVMAALMGGGESPDFGKHKSVGCYGCYGYGCHSAGYSGHSSCHGYSGCHGSCWGGACYGSYSCAGGWGGACYGSWSCWGCYGCTSTSPYFKMYDGPVMPPAEVKPDDGKKKTSIEKERARLVIEVPADAKLFIDDQHMKTASEKRVFNTPTLEKGATYYYILRVEVAREGTTHMETRRILIKAGDEVTQSFTESSIASASKAGTTAASR